MTGIDFGALTAPVFASVFAAGWTACYTILVKPLTKRVDALEAAQARNEEERKEELRQLRDKVLGK